MKCLQIFSRILRNNAIACLVGLYRLYTKYIFRTSLLHIGRAVHKQTKSSTATSEKVNAKKTLEFSRTARPQLANSSAGDRRRFACNQVINNNIVIYTVTLRKQRPRFGKRLFIVSVSLSDSSNSFFSIAIHVAERFLRAPALIPLAPPFPLSTSRRTHRGAQRDKREVDAIQDFSRCHIRIWRLHLISQAHQWHQWFISYGHQNVLFARKRSTISLVFN